jgi:hypothetical protein
MLETVIRKQFTSPLYAAIELEMSKSLVREYVEIIEDLAGTRKG